MARPRKGEEKHASERVGVRMPSWVRAGLDRLAAERKAPITDVINEGLAAYLKRQGIKPEPIVPNKETIAAMEEARKGGLKKHRSVKALLKSLNEDD